MKKSAGVIVVLLVAVSIIGVVFANSHSSTKSDAKSSVVALTNTQQDVMADQSKPQSIAIQASPEPCLMILIGVGGLIYVVGKKRRSRRRRSA
ncbi:MAG: hypothetical protein KAR11_01270 [Phycisphaerae bacterium]|nr:hypothetical protein [Phycisphaerae bacterium]